MPSKFRPVSFLLGAALFLAQVPLRGQEPCRLEPQSPEQFYLLPGVEASLGFKVAGQGDRLAYTVTDYNGGAVAAGSATPTAARLLTIRLKLKTGFYDLRVAKTGQRFGVVVLPDARGPADPFFCLDAGLSWNGWSDAAKKAMVELFVRKGLDLFRERLSWPAINPEKDVYERLDSAKGFTPRTQDTVRYGAIRLGVYPKDRPRILELLEDSPLFLRHEPDNKFSVDLTELYKSWTTIQRAYGRTWAAFEVWNEPYNYVAVPGDQYVPLVKGMAAALNRSGDAASRVLIVGGCLTTSVPTSYLNACGDNGLFEYADILSIHGYGAPEDVVPTVRHFRAWMERYGHATMPVWLTESGEPTLDTPAGRPEEADEKRVAAIITMRGLEAFACGLSSYYPFYLGPHVEGSSFWGLTARDGSPTRSLGNWLFAAVRLSNHHYLGDLPVTGEGIKLARVFGNAREAVAVLYGKAGATVTVPGKVLAVQGADGRPLATRGGAFLLADGLAYVTLARDALPKLVVETEAMKLFRLKTPPAPPKQGRPLLLQIAVPFTTVQSHTTGGYFLNSRQAAAFPFQAYIYNLSPTPLAATVTLKLQHGATALQPLGKTLTLAPCSSTKLDWTVNLTNAFADGKTRLDLETRSGAWVDQAVLLLSQQRPKQTYGVVQGPETVTPDGRAAAGEWDKAQIIDSLSGFTSVDPFKPVPFNDLAATARFQWNSFGLCYLVQVRDQTHTQELAPDLAWKQDSLQIGFARNQAELEQAQSEWVFSLGGAGMARSRTTGGEPLSAASVCAIVHDAKAGLTTYEGRLAWADLADLGHVNPGMLPNQRFRLTFLVNDLGSNGSRRWLEWTPGIATAKHPDTFPELVLLPAAAAPLVKDDFKAGKLDPKKGWLVPPGDGWTVFSNATGSHLRVKESGGSQLKLKFPPLKKRSFLAVSYTVSTPGFNGIGFIFRASLIKGATGEGYTLHSAPNNQFCGTTGYALGDHLAKGQWLGFAGNNVHLDPATSQRVTFQLDLASQDLKVLVNDGTGGRVVATGRGQQSELDVDTLIFETTAWGATEIILDDLAVTGEGN